MSWCSVFTSYKETWILLATVTFLLWIYFKRRLGVLKRLGIPHDDPGFLGLKYVMQLSKDPDEMLLRDDFNMRKKYGDIYGRYQFLSPIITIWDTEILKELFVKEFHNFPDRQKWMLKINGEMNDSLVNASGNQWKRIRKTLSPAFSSSKLKQMLYIAENCTEIFMKKMQNIVEKKDGIFHARTDFGRYALDVISSAAFSSNFHVQDGEKEPKTMKLLNEAISPDSFKDPVIALLTVFSFLEPVFAWFDYSIFSREFRKHMVALTDAVQKTRNKDQKRVDLMQQMLEVQIPDSEVATATRGMTKKEVTGNALIMISAGYETTAQSLTFLAYNLANNQHVQDKLREEILEAVDRHDGKITYETINDIPYLMQCINESLRYLPVVPLNSRFADNDVTIKGVKIPKGTWIHIPVAGLSRAEEYWDSPDEFRPERFEDMSKVDVGGAFQPFGGGPRSCIGMRFALMEMKLVMCHMLMKYKILTCDLTPEEPLEMTLTLTVTSKKEVVLKLEEL